jgi:Fe-S-cluster containining protein
MPINPCLRCGACCAFYRASFYWAEADDAPGGSVPVAMTVQVTPMQRAMRGTSQSNPRCCALEGEIGQAVACSIYPSRASPCRDFPASWVDDQPNERCDKARLAWGLQPLSPDDLRDDPRAA